ncbi:hypothetical protein [Exiguobacterium sp. N4-1P]|uniref:hypothetical protein n=1 Tax=Exiguobacterium sp. N4-1P TaxID=2051906 RepID=UPI0012FF635C|nr:hypothetical protein [Exiguobacterium sp. N4-1P]
MKSEYAITSGKVRASLSRLVFKAAIGRGSKRFETDCALNRLHAWISVTVLPEKRHVSLTPTGKSAFLTRLAEADKPLLVVR